MAKPLRVRVRLARVLARKAARNRAEIRRRAAAQVARRVGTIGTRGLLSVVIPAYNVEKYLADCLDSVLAQTYWKLEAIVVVDGATDNTLAIAQSYAARDKRVRVYAQANAGLSGARNTGAQLARGEYLWFVDSDDVLLRKAAATMIAALAESGSDFAVGSYVRFDSSKPNIAPGRWIRTLHSSARPRTTLSVSPDVLVNAVAWSKVYRCRFWVDNGLSFIDRMLYEDQPASARAYARARAFDIVPDVIYRWRMRDDQSSISQQSHQLSDLQARLHSFDSALAELRRSATEAAVTERTVQILANDLQISMAHLAEADDEFWAALADGIESLVHGLPPERWRDIPPAHAGLVWLLAHHDLASARRYLDLGGQDASRQNSALRDGVLVCAVPMWDDPAIQFPTEVLEFAPRQLRIVSQLHRARWIKPGVLRLHGWAYIPSVAAEHMNGPLVTRLVSDEQPPHIVPLTTTPAHEPDIDRLSRQARIDHRDFAWDAEVDVDELGLHVGAQYQIEFELAAGGARCTERLWRVTAPNSAAAIPNSSSLEGRTAVIHHPRRQPFELRIVPAVTVQKVATPQQPGQSTAVDLAVHSSAGPVRRIYLTPLNAKGALLVNHKMSLPATKNPDGSHRVELRPSQRALSTHAHWVASARTSHGEVPVTWDGGVGPVVLERPGAGSHGMAVHCDAAGRLALWRFQAAAAITSIEACADSTRISGWFLGDQPTKATLSDHRVSVSCAMTSPQPGAFTIEVPWECDRWGRTRPLPMGLYRLEVRTGRKAVEAVVDSAAVAVLPVAAPPDAPVVARWERGPRQTLALAVDATLDVEERGARNRQRLIDDHRDGVHPLDSGAVLMRTYYGESTTDNALAIHDELRARGSDLRVYWTVKDSSVAVPQGGIAVVAGSGEWFRLLSEAKYLVDNVHQVPYFTKRPGQVFVETLHGYPFKVAGLSYWKSAGYSQARIDSFLERHRQWDYLVSPAPYATPLLERDFPGAARILEIGYPRNDIFFSERRHRLRESTRARLGIGDDATAVLYAPTYRDNLSSTEFKAAMVDFLDLRRLREALGEQFVILVRGHMMNARTNARTAAQPGIVDVTDYPEITELCLASDAAILDYSSLRFDYALTGNPIVFHVPDLEVYRDDARGWMLPYEETAPGPLARTTDDVINALTDLDALAAQFEGIRAEFLGRYMPLEDGKAAARLVDAVFEP